MLLGDNGSEFSNPKALECDRDGRQRTRVFYCDPSAPYQKGAAERNHEFIRMFLPKGTSFDGLAQEDVDLMMDHINSCRRQDLGDRSPYDMMLFMYGKEVVDNLGIHRIPADEITLKKEIFRKDGRNDAEEKDWP